VTAHDLDREYSPSALLPDPAAQFAEYARRSAVTRTRLVAHRNLRYGASGRMTLDLFPAAQQASPLLVYVHGGFWQEMSKDDFVFPAEGAVAAGAAFAALGYVLAPDHGMDEIVTSVRAGLWWLVDHARALGVAPARIHLCGHSAGAHLVAMALLAGWPPDGRLPADVFAGATLLSGIYDLEPVRHTYVNEPLRLDRAGAARNSPLRTLPDRLPPLVLACGATETDEFHRQQRQFGAAVRARGASVTELVVKRRHHFDIMDDLTDPTTELGRAVRRQLRESSGISFLY